jgi:FkbM family methyltransferase
MWGFMRNWVIVFLLVVSPCFAIEKLPRRNARAALNFAKKYLPRNAAILECGGYDGNDTVLMAKIWPKGTIYTFEPVPVLFSRLQERVKSFPNVHAYELALGDFCGKSTFYISKCKGKNSGSSSLLPPKEHTKKIPQVKFNETIEVDVLSLDAWAERNRVQHIDFLWLDMQGYELNMLKASELAKKAKAIYIEVEFIDLYAGQYLYSDIEQWMTENGFELTAADFEFDSQGKTHVDFGNALFIKK